MRGDTFSRAIVCRNNGSACVVGIMNFEEEIGSRMMHSMGQLHVETMGHPGLLGLCLYTHTRAQNGK